MKEEHRGQNFQVTSSRSSRNDLSKYAWLSVCAAVLTIVLKTVAFFITGSVGLLSDAAESVVNLVAAVVAVVALRQAAKPADHKYTFGRSKAEYFSSSVEGVMIFIAAGFIIVSAVGRMIRPEPVENLGPGLVVSIAASLINGVIAFILFRAAKKHSSPALRSDAYHLGTDVLTSVGVVLGVALVSITGRDILDPIVALLVGLNILFTGYRLLQGSVQGLMDISLDPEHNKALVATLEEHSNAHIQFHGLQTRVAGQMSFASVHMLVPGNWTVLQGHTFAHDVAQAIEKVVPGLQADIHVEPIEDPRSYEDIPEGSFSIGDGDTLRELS